MHPAPSETLPAVRLVAECENGPPKRPVRRISGPRYLGLSLDFRQRAHLFSGHAEPDVHATAGEFALRNGDQLTADAEEAAGLDVDGGDLAVSVSGHAVDRAQVIAI